MKRETICGDALEVLRTLPDESVHCCVTSPPYWSLRDYGVDGQLGLEKTVEEYVERLVGVFKEVRRILRDDGTVWLNLGDSYNGSGGVGGSGKQHTNQGSVDRRDNRAGWCGLKPKDLVGIPWRVAFALQADGWWLRSDIIWAKPNPMPESVRDRPTSSHEHIFLLTKSGESLFWTHRDMSLEERIYEKPSPDYRWIHRTTGEEILSDPNDPDKWRQINLWRGNDYYYDHEAIKEPSIYGPQPPPAGWDLSEGRHGTIHKKGRTSYADRKDKQRGHGRRHDGFNDRWDQMSREEQCSIGRNKRSVWTVATRPFKEAHFAVFPPDLIRPCVLAGCPEGGTVLDPFFGAGTTGLVAKQEGRGYIGIELNPEYVEMARARINAQCPMDRLI